MDGVNELNDLICCVIRMWKLMSDCRLVLHPYTATLSKHHCQSVTVEEFHYDIDRSSHQTSFPQEARNLCSP